MASTAYNGARIMAAPLLFIVTEFNRLESYVLAGSGNSSALSLGQYLNGEFSTQNANTLMILTIIIGVIGFICQFKADKKR